MLPHISTRIGLFMFSEEDLQPISALQHLLFCERQCALIHIECLWEENLFTAEGRIMHEKAHSGKSESRREVRICCGMSVRSLELGLIGKTDVVEFHKNSSKWIPFPVEYKRGRQKRINCDRVQLCAQALCLEEMLDIDVAEGALFYGKARKREVVLFDKPLRKETVETIDKLHNLIEKGITPSGVYTAACRNCSLAAQCLPQTAGKRKSVKNYYKRMMEDL